MSTFIYIIFDLISKLFSRYPFVTLHFERCQIQVLVAAFSTSPPMMSLSSKLFNTRRVNSCRNFFLDTTWYAEWLEFSIHILTVFCFQNLNQNPRTLLPKFFGLFCYQCNSKNVRLVTMNNLLPSWVKMHQKYDLKGSTYKRKVIHLVEFKITYSDLPFKL